MPFVAGKGGRAAPVSLMPVTRAVLLTKEDLENFHNSALNKDSVGSLLPLGSGVPVTSAPAPSTAQGGAPPLWPPPPRRRTRSASTRRHPRTSAEVSSALPTPNVLPNPSVTPGSNMVFYNAASNAAGAAGTVPSALVCEKPNGLIPASAIKKPSRVVRAKTLSRMDRISPEPPLAQGSNDCPGLVLQGHDIRRICRDFPEPRIPEVPSHPDNSPEMVAAARLNQFLQVSGCTALVSVPSADPVPSAPFEDEWSSDGDDHSDDSDAFDLRQYRYTRSNPAAPTACSVAAPVAVLARKWRRAAASRATNVEDGLDDAVVAWSAVATGAPLVTSQGDRLLADADDDSESLEKDERRDLELQRIGDALVEFYGLGEAKRAIRFKSNVVNVVMVTEEAWRLKERESQLDEPPLFWLRGNRVYDFHGDRGTVADFEADLLTREVEDDATCRSRRQKQGLLPFPFLPLPQKEKVEDDDGNDANRAPKR